MTKLLFCASPAWALFAAGFGLATFGVVAHPSRANPALRVIDERIAEFVTQFGQCRQEGLTTITACFAGKYGKKTTAAMIACFRGDALPQPHRLTQDQQTCVLDVSFTADAELWGG
jgi:hypothetical protein